MAGKDWNFTVEADDLEPFGPVRKENLDITRLVFDMACWLDDEGVPEPISFVTHPFIMASPTSQPWQTDYPLGAGTTELPPDDYPLVINGMAISGPSSNRVEVRVGSGTPGLTYVVSIVVTGAVTARRKQIDCLVEIDIPLNPALLTVTPAPAPPPPIIVGGNTNLPEGYDGRVYVQNTSGAPISIVLPPNPTPLQRIAPVDIVGNFDQYPCTYYGATGDLIYAATFFLDEYPFDDLTFEWTGDHWIILANGYSWIG